MPPNTSTTITDLPRHVLQHLSRQYLPAEAEETLRATSKHMKSTLPAKERVSSAFEKELDNLEFGYGDDKTTFTSKGPYDIIVKYAPMTNTSSSPIVLSLRFTKFGLYDSDKIMVDLLGLSNPETIYYRSKKLAKHQQMEAYMTAKYIMESWLQKKTGCTFVNTDYILEYLKTKFNLTPQDISKAVYPPYLIARLQGLRVSIKSEDNPVGAKILSATTPYIYGYVSKESLVLRTLNGDLTFHLDFGAWKLGPGKPHSSGFGNLRVMKLEYTAFLTKLQELAKKGIIDPSMPADEVDKLAQKYFTSDEFTSLASSPVSSGGSRRKSVKR